MFVQSGSIQTNDSFQGTIVSGVSGVPGVPAVSGVGSLGSLRVPGVLGVPGVGVPKRFIGSLKFMVNYFSQIDGANPCR